ncbi:MAG: adenylate kinase [Anaerolineaceae bacterium]|nr:adenylate kinase [Anaerolineaceae bacterium]MBN2676531.1 adenylate kinase [Anaerolineaceae bacterium]
MRIYLVLLGPPGAGKGTQAQILAEKFNLVHVSSGDLFRENLKNKTVLGQKAQAYVDRGELVPDDITIGMVKDRLMKSDCDNGAILDGFPRTPAQAEALAKLLSEMDGKVVSVPFISVPVETLIERLSGRWTCQAQGHIYHEKNNPPRVAGICDLDGSALYQREDDKRETVMHRIQVYQDQTAPLIEYYRKQNLLTEIDGTIGIENVTDRMITAIQEAL